MARTNVYIGLLLITIFSVGCNEDGSEPTSSIQNAFSLVPATHTNIDFVNSIHETDEFNFLNYAYIYNGGGVSIGDINNDGLDDVFLSSNQGKNKLYLNKGDLKFEDISAQAGVEDATGWTTGVSMIDINNDGWLDIYVCKSGQVQQPELRVNRLFINNKDNTFSDQAERYQLNDPSFSTQAYFFDFDQDQDLDMYLVNHRVDFNNNTIISSDIQRAISEYSTDKLFVQDKSKFYSVFTNGINKTWGLSAAVADFNEDGLSDIYVCNDFLEPDQLMINIPNGPFEDKILSNMNHISFYSMGSDVADVNNDAKLDLMVLDMSPADHGRSKRNMASMDVEIFNRMVSIGYHQQYMSNMLQLKRANENYSEIGQFAGVSKTDWSWAPLFADLDNDGLKDLFITNGIRRDLTENDLRTRIKEKHATQGTLSIDDALSLTHSERIQNRIYANKGHGKFEDKTLEWGMDQKSFSNGAAYSDLDNDGDLDLVINNIDDKAFVYKNNAQHNYLSIKFKGGPTNTQGLGSTVELFAKDLHQYYQQYTNRGFQSSVSPVMHVGLREHKKIDSLRITWYNGKVQVLHDLKVNQQLVLDINNADLNVRKKIAKPQTVLPYTNASLASYIHNENEYLDFQKEILLPQKQSNFGPRACVGDVNKDGLDDFFVGGAKGFSAVLYLQNADQSFTQNSNMFGRDAAYEDTGCMFIDVDQDGDLDLYVVSGGNEIDANSALLQDRMYINDGKGNFKKDTRRLPEMLTSGYAVAQADYDGDGDLDLFVGGRIIPGKYPLPPRSYLLENVDGYYKDVTASKAESMQNIGIITAGLFSDYDGDGDLDLIVTGEWFAPKVFVNHGNSFEAKVLDENLEPGWFYSIAEGDFNGDGKPDYVFGNLGDNNKFQPNKDKPLHLYAGDFDDSGNIDIVLAKKSDDVLYPVRGLECSSEQMPFIDEKFPDYKSFSEADLKRIYTQERLDTALHLIATNFKTVCLINKGTGNFVQAKIPDLVQYGPTLKILIADVNQDGFQDIIGAGDMYETEPETVSYDASKGYILINDGKGTFTASMDNGFLLNGNVKDIQLMQIGGKHILLAFQNVGPLQMFQLR